VAARPDDKALAVRAAGVGGLDKTYLGVSTVTTEEPPEGRSLRSEFRPGFGRASDQGRDGPQEVFRPPVTSEAEASAWPCSSAIVQTAHPTASNCSVQVNDRPAMDLPPGGNLRRTLRLA
jgi:hypothetical protein